MNELVANSSSSLGKFIPQSLSEIIPLAQALAKSNMIPDHYQNNAGNIIAALQLGAELKVPPMTMLSNSFPVNNKISLMTDMLMAIVKNQPSYGGVKVIEETDKAFEAEAYRLLAGGNKETMRVRFTKEDAERAGLWGKTDVWRKYPQRMLKHRGMAYLAKAGWPDALGGIYTYEEIASYTPSAPTLRDVTPNPEAGNIVSVVDSLELEPKKLSDLIDLAKQARLNNKLITEIRKSYFNLESNAAALEKFLSKKRKELQERLDSFGAKAGVINEDETDE